MVQQNQPTKTKMDEQREKNMQFLKSITRILKGAATGEYSTATIRKRKEAEAARRKAKKEELARRKKALMKEKMVLAEKLFKQKQDAAGKQKVKKTSVKDVAPPTTGKRKVSDKNKIKVVGGFKRVLTKDPAASKKQQSQIKKPRTVAEAQKAGLLYFTNKKGEKRLAITSAQLKQFQKKHGITSYSKALTKFANMYKPGSGMAKFKADMKKKK
jgi:hypothetical protein